MLDNLWQVSTPFQLILNPIRDWKGIFALKVEGKALFQLILNPIRDWKDNAPLERQLKYYVPINLKPY